MGKRGLRNFPELLALWTPAQLSRLLQVPLQTAVAMYVRGSIGPAHWSRILEVIEARGEQLTAADLLRFHDLTRRHRRAARLDRQHQRKLHSTQNAAE